MSLEPNLAALVAASTKLTKSITMPLSVVNGKRDAATTAQADITAAETAIAAASATATTDASTTASKLTAVAADYAAQKTTKGLAAVQTSADSELKDRLHRRDPARHPFRGARPSLVMDFVRRECHRNNAAGNLEPVDLSTFMTFTRGSTATYVGPDGLIKEAASNVPRYGYDQVTGEALGLLIEEQRTNLVTYSMQSAMAGWNKTGVSALANTIISPAGDLTGGTVSVSTAGQSNISIPVTLVAGVVYTTSVYVKAGNTNVVTIKLGRGPTVLANADITLGTSAEAVHVGNGWYRCTITSAASDGINGGVLVYPGGRISQSVGDYVYIWGAQCEAGAFPTSYIPTPSTFTGRASTKTYFDSNGVLQTAASGVAVTDYGYVDGRWVSKGLSLEPQATNLALQSSITQPLGITATVEFDVVAAPDGTNTADKLVAATTIQPRCEKNITSPTVDTQYTWSFFAKKGSNDFVSAGHYSGAASAWVIFNLSTGVVVSTTGASCVGRIASVGNGWFRCSMTITVLANSTYNYFKAMQCEGVKPEIGAVGGYVYLWGFQIETGPVATSYIPTTTAQVTRAADTSTSAQVTRAADSAVSTQAAGLYNLDSGTTCAEVLQSRNGSYPGMYHWVNDYSAYFHSGLGQNMLNGRSGLGIGAITAGAALSKTRHAVKRTRSAMLIGMNNTVPIAGAFLLPPAASVTTLYIGRADSYWNGYIRQLTYFPRQLSDADLQALTILED